MAGTLAGGHGAQVDGLAAASLRGWWNRHVDRIDVTLPDRSLHAAPERWRFRRASSGLWLPQPDDLVGPIHVACALQVILTAAATSDATPHQLAFIMSEAIRDGHVTMTELEQLVVDRRGWRGIAAVRSAVAMVRQGSWGTRCFTEDCYVSEFERAGLELPRVNQRGALGLVRDEPDFVWDEQRANVESDGAHHDHPSQREDDRQRDITAMGLGWRVLRVRARDFHRHRRKVMAAVLAFVHGAEVPVIPGTRVLAIG